MMMIIIIQTRSCVYVCIGGIMQHVLVVQVYPIAIIAASPSPADP